MAAVVETTAPDVETGERKRSPSQTAIRWILPPHHRTTWLGEERLLVGRDDDCHVSLPGNSLSRHHADIVRDGPLHLVRDLGSLNGVAVNGKRVSHAPLSPGDVLRLGSWLGLVLADPLVPPPGVPAFRKLAENLYGGPIFAAFLDEAARRTAPSKLTTVIVGETGTGKECVARAIHAWSGREGDFVAVNCAAISEQLAEAELFGYRKGAFAGAVQASQGHFRAARSGTLFLDEICELAPSIQAKLLRAIERHEVLPLGESRPVATDVHVVVAAQESLESAVDGGTFRGDLYARLNELTIQLPPLRERKEDIPFLFDRVLRDQTADEPPAVSAKLMEALCLYDWPFNVRELVNLAKRLAALYGHERELSRSHLPPALLAPLKASEETSHPDMAEMDSEPSGGRKLALLLSALRKHRGVVSRAAREVGIPRQSVYRLLDARPDLVLDDFRAARGGAAARARGRDDESA